jgi:predicted nucleic acid-binding protein
VSQEKRFTSADKVFIDTNILVYAYDTSAGIKHQKARKILADLWDSGLGVVSTQVLQEFFVTVTRKLPKRMDSAAARNVISDMLEWDLVAINGTMILDAIDLHRSHDYSFWDSLIVVAAERAGCALLLSEDLSAGHTIRGVTVQNPFG